MMAELLAADPSIDVRILGLNAIGREAGNAENCAGRTIPWLQDTQLDHVWDDWAIAWRDVVILDRDNVPVDVYNLTTYDLSVPANYDELKARILAAR